MYSDQGCQGDVEIGTYDSGFTKMCLMQCIKCTGLYVVKMWDEFLWIVDLEPAPQPPSAFEKEQETALARQYKSAVKEGRVCSCGGASPIRGSCVSEDDLPRDYVVEELVEL